MEKIKTENLRFVDPQGRTRLFNGMNIDDKLLNSETFRYDLDEEFFKKYAANGFNLIRLAVTWANLEPQMGVYSERYLESLDGIFRNAEKYGVYIFLDMHQDLYSAFGGRGVGDGAPEWATVTDGFEPKKPKYVWIEGYIWGKCVHRSFDHFWNNDPVGGRGLQDRFADLWRMLAARYGNSPALFGFDLLNEPFPGSDSKKMISRLTRGMLKAILFNRKISCRGMIKALIKKDTPKLLDSIGGDVVRDVMEKVDPVSAEFDRTKYSPFLNKMAAAIREVTPNGIIMIEQSFLCNSGVKQSVPAVTVDGKREELQCFAPHSYDMTVDTPLYKYANSGRVKAFFDEMRNTQLRLNVPVVVGEWGGSSDNKDTSWFGHAYDLLDYFDEKQWSQTYWDYRGDNDLDAPLMQMLSRTHPVAVAGTIDKYFMDREKNIFTLEYHADSEGESLVYIHKPADVICDGKAETVEEYPNGARLVSIAAAAGAHKVEIRIK